MLPVSRNYQPLFHNFFDDLFDLGSEDSILKEYRGVSSPAMNIIENEDEYRVEFAAPGVSKDHFTVRVDNEKNLVVTMENQEESNSEDKKASKAERKCKKGEKYLHREFSYQKYEQTLALPDKVKVNEIKASMLDGVLTVIVPKNKEELKAIQIDIQ